MHNKRFAPYAIAAAAILLLAGVATSGQPTDKDGGVTDDLSTVPGGFNGNTDYTGGPNVCGGCHYAEFEEWLLHGHSRKIALAYYPGGSVQNTDVGDRGFTAHARSQGFRLPAHDSDVYNWDNVMFVVGGSKYWKSRFVDKDGYFLTLNGKNQYNWATGEWVDYHADEVMKPFNCGSCHTTGYRPEGTAFAEESPGIVGDFSHVNITCEACHGPGAAHAAAPSSDNIMIDSSAAACGACHTRGDDDTVALASGGFIRHHEQYPEFLNSPHMNFSCTSCHNEHRGRRDGITTECESCHGSQATEFAGSAMEMAGVMCQDCHMGRATKSARANGPYEGDVWTHIFRIDNGADYDMFNRDGEGNTTSAKDAISLEFACFRCHADADKAAYAAIGDDGTAYHTLGK